MAKQMIDIAHDDSTDDLQWVNGDLAEAEATRAHQKDLLLSEKGEWKESPTVGVGILSHLDDEGISDLLRAINMEFAKDGMKVIEVSINKNGEIETNAYYE